jgi:hypothetical protein
MIITAVVLTPVALDLFVAPWSTRWPTTGAIRAR